MADPLTLLLIGGGIAWLIKNKGEGGPIRSDTLPAERPHPGEIWQDVPFAWIEFNSSETTGVNFASQEFSHGDGGEEYVVINNNEDPDLAEAMDRTKYHVQDNYNFSYTHHLLDQAHLHGDIMVSQTVGQTQTNA